jgi:ParB-like chromosome segregation protein Spo0J
MKKTNKNETTSMRLEKLRPHPLQTSCFSACTAAEDKALADDLRANGQRDPIAIMPAGNAAGLDPNTILDGHRRVEQLRSIGIKMVKVIVRHDLKDADAATVNKVFLQFNYQRRQLEPIEKARIVLKLLEQECGHVLKRFDGRERQKLKDQMDAALGMGDKNRTRYISVLSTPMPIQDAVKDGLIGLKEGVTISTLPAAQQEALAGAIRGLSDKKEVRRIAGEYMATRKSGRHAKAGTGFGALIRALTPSVADIEDRIDEISAAAAARNLDLLRRTQKMINALVERGEKAPPPDAFFDFEPGALELMSKQAARRRSA